MEKRFSKLLKYKKRSNHKYFVSKKPYKKKEKGATPTCFECGKQGHIKPDCLVFELKQSW